jgi:hypothetical protein
MEIHCNGNTGKISDANDYSNFAIYDDYGNKLCGLVVCTEDVAEPYIRVMSPRYPFDILDNVGGLLGKVSNE